MDDNINNNTKTDKIKVDYTNVFIFGSSSCCNKHAMDGGSCLDSDDDFRTWVRGVDSIRHCWADAMVGKL